MNDDSKPKKKKRRHREAACLCGEGRGVLLPCAAQVSTCRGRFHPACCGLSKVPRHKKQVGSPHSLPSADDANEGDLACDFYCSLCVTAWLSAPVPRLAAPRLPPPSVTFAAKRAQPTTLGGKSVAAAGAASEALLEISDDGEGVGGGVGGGGLARASALREEPLEQGGDEESGGVSEVTFKVVVAAPESEDKEGDEKDGKGEDEEEEIEKVEEEEEEEEDSEDMEKEEEEEKEEEVKEVLLADGGWGGVLTSRARELLIFGGHTRDDGGGRAGRGHEAADNKGHGNASGTRSSGSNGVDPACTPPSPSSSPASGAIATTAVVDFDLPNNLKSRRYTKGWASNGALPSSTSSGPTSSSAAGCAGGGGGGGGNRSFVVCAQSLLECLGKVASALPPERLRSRRLKIDKRINKKEKKSQTTAALSGLPTAAAANDSAPTGNSAALLTMATLLQAPPPSNSQLRALKRALLLDATAAGATAAASKEARKLVRQRIKEALKAARWHRALLKDEALDQKVRGALRKGTRALTAMVGFMDFLKKYTDGSKAAPKIAENSSDSSSQQQQQEQQTVGAVSTAATAAPTESDNSNSNSSVDCSGSSSRNGSGGGGRNSSSSSSVDSGGGDCAGSWIKSMMCAESWDAFSKAADAGVAATVEAAAAGDRTAPRADGAASLDTQCPAAGGVTAGTAKGKHTAVFPAARTATTTPTADAVIDSAGSTTAAAAAAKAAVTATNVSSTSTSEQESFHQQSPSSLSDSLANAEEFIAAAPAPAAAAAPDAPDASPPSSPMATLRELDEYLALATWARTQWKQQPEGLLTEGDGDGEKSSDDQDNGQGKSQRQQQQQKHRWRKQQRQQQLQLQLPLHRKSVVRVRRALLKALEGSVASLSESVDTVEPHVSYRPDGTSELVSFAPNSMAERARKTVGGGEVGAFVSCGGGGGGGGRGGGYSSTMTSSAPSSSSSSSSSSSFCRHVEIDLIDPPEQVDIDISMLRNCILCPHHATDLRGMTHARTVGLLDATNKEAQETEEGKGGDDTTTKTTTLSKTQMQTQGQATTTKRVAGVVGNRAFLAALSSPTPALLAPPNVNKNKKDGTTAALPTPVPPSGKNKCGASAKGGHENKQLPAQRQQKQQKPLLLPSVGYSSGDDDDGGVASIRKKRKPPQTNKKAPSSPPKQNKKGPATATAEKTSSLTRVKEDNGGGISRGTRDEKKSKQNKMKKKKKTAEEKEMEEQDQEEENLLCDGDSVGCGGGSTMTTTTISTTMMTAEAVVDNDLMTMVGEREVVAACPIRAGTVGPYSGLVVHDREITSVLSSPRQLLLMMHYWFSMAYQVPGFNFSLFPNLSNPMCMINDYCGPDRSPERKASLQHGPNCYYVATKVNSWPHIFVVALRHIAEGEALTVDYGDGFWKNFTLLNDLEAAFESCLHECFESVAAVSTVLAFDDAGGDEDEEGKNGSWGYRKSGKCRKKVGNSKERKGGGWCVWLRRREQKQRKQRLAQKREQQSRLLLHPPPLKSLNGCHDDSSSEAETSEGAAAGGEAGEAGSTAVSEAGPRKATTNAIWDTHGYDHDDDDDFDDSDDSDDDDSDVSDDDSEDKSALNNGASSQASDASDYSEQEAMFDSDDWWTDDDGDSNAFDCAGWSGGGGSDGRDNYNEIKNENEAERHFSTSESMPSVVLRWCLARGPPPSSSLISSSLPSSSSSSFLSGVGGDGDGVGDMIETSPPSHSNGHLAPHKKAVVEGFTARQRSREESTGCRQQQGHQEKKKHEQDLQEQEHVAQHTVVPDADDNAVAVHKDGDHGDSNGDGGGDDRRDALFEERTGLRPSLLAHAALSVPAAVIGLGCPLPQPLALVWVQQQERKRQQEEPPPPPSSSSSLLTAAVAAVPESPSPPFVRFPVNVASLPFVQRLRTFLCFLQGVAGGGSIEWGESQVPAGATNNNNQSDVKHEHGGPGDDVGEEEESCGGDHRDRFRLHPEAVMVAVVEDEAEEKREENEKEARTIQNVSTLKTGDDDDDDGDDHNDISTTATRKAGSNSSSSYSSYSSSYSSSSSSSSKGKKENTYAARNCSRRGRAGKRAASSVVSCSATAASGRAKKWCAYEKNESSSSSSGGGGVNLVRMAALLVFERFEVENLFDLLRMHGFVPSTTPLVQTPPHSSSFSSASPAPQTNPLFVSRISLTPSALSSLTDSSTPPSHLPSSSSSSSPLSLSSVDAVCIHSWSHHHSLLSSHESSSSLFRENVLALDHLIVVANTSFPHVQTRQSISPSSSACLFRQPLPIGSGSGNSDGVSAIASAAAAAAAGGGASAVKVSVALGSPLGIGVHERTLAVNFFPIEAMPTTTTTAAAEAAIAAAEMATAEAETATVAASLQARRPWRKQLQQKQLPPPLKQPAPLQQSSQENNQQLKKQQQRQHRQQQQRHAMLRAGVRVGWRIIAVDDEPVCDLKELCAALEKRQKQQRPWRKQAATKAKAATAKAATAKEKAVAAPAVVPAVASSSKDAASSCVLTFTPPPPPETYRLQSEWGEARAATTAGGQEGRDCSGMCNVAATDGGCGEGSEWCGPRYVSGGLPCGPTRVLAVLEGDPTQTWYPGLLIGTSTTAAADATTAAAAATAVSGVSSVVDSAQGKDGDDEEGGEEAGSDKAGKNKKQKMGHEWVKAKQYSDCAEKGKKKKKKKKNSEVAGGSGKGRHDADDDEDDADNDRGGSVNEDAGKAHGALPTAAAASLRYYTVAFDDGDVETLPTKNVHILDFSAPSFSSSSSSSSSLPPSSSPSLLTSGSSGGSNRDNGCSESEGISTLSKRRGKQLRCGGRRAGGEANGKTVEDLDGGDEDSDDEDEDTDYEDGDDEDTDYEDDDDSSPVSSPPSCPLPFTPPAGPDADDPTVLAATALIHQELRNDERKAQEAQRRVRRRWRRWRRQREEKGDGEKVEGEHGASSTRAPVVVGDGSAGAGGGEWKQVSSPLATSSTAEQHQRQRQHGEGGHEEEEEDVNQRGERALRWVGGKKNLVKQLPEEKKRAVVVRWDMSRGRPAAGISANLTSSSSSSSSSSSPSTSVAAISTSTNACFGDGDSGGGGGFGGAVEATRVCFHFPGAGLFAGRLIAVHPATYPPKRRDTERDTETKEEKEKKKKKKKNEEEEEEEDKSGSSHEPPFTESHGDFRTSSSSQDNGSGPRRVRGQGLAGRGQGELRARRHASWVVSFDDGEVKAIRGDPAALQFAVDLGANTSVCHLVASCQASLDEYGDQDRVDDGSWLPATAMADAAIASTTTAASWPRRRDEAGLWAEAAAEVRSIADAAVRFKGAIHNYVARDYDDQYCRREKSAKGESGGGDDNNGSIHGGGGGGGGGGDREEEEEEGGIGDDCENSPQRIEGGSACGESSGNKKRKKERAEGRGTEKAPKVQARAQQAQAQEEEEAAVEACHKSLKACMCPVCGQLYSRVDGAKNHLLRKHPTEAAVLLKGVRIVKGVLRKGEVEGQTIRQQHDLMLPPPPTSIRPPSAGSSSFSSLSSSSEAAAVHWNSIAKASYSRSDPDRRRNRALFFFVGQSVKAQFQGYEEWYEGCVQKVHRAKREGFAEAPGSGKRKSRVAATEDDEDEEDEDSESGEIVSVDVAYADGDFEAEVPVSQVRQIFDRLDK